MKLRTMWNSLKDWCESLRKPDTKWRIRVEGDEIVSQNENLGTINWHLHLNEIEEIASWKLDLWSCDEICVGFKIADSDDFYLCCESDSGFKEMIEEVTSRFPLKEEWRQSVMFPPLAENFTVLWKQFSAAPAPDAA